MSYLSARRRPEESAQRAGLFFVIVLAHVGFAALLLTLREPIIQLVHGEPIEVVFVPGEKSPDPPRVLRPEVRDPRLVDLVVPVFDLPAAPTAITAMSVSREPSVVPQAAGESEVPLQVDSVDYLTPPAPRYPVAAKRARVQGVVMLRVVVDVYGRPAQILVEQSSGNMDLDEAARRAVMDALFRPYQINGVARAATVLIPIEFSLTVRSARAG
ncbi:MAG: TonB family protein [Steroidobacteraceae bacterium]